MIESIALNFITTSIQKCDTEQGKKIELALKTKYSSFYENIFTYGKLIGSVNLWIQELTAPDTFVLDDDPHHIHFRNQQKFDLRDGIFKPRVKEDNISKYINRDYHSVNLDHLVEIENLLMNNFQEPEALQVIRATIGASLSGWNARHCNMQCLYGEGSSGKSTIFNLIKTMLDPHYYYMLGSDALSTYAMANRALQDVPSTARFLFLNEPSANTKVNGSAIKLICDGEVTGKKLFKEGSFTNNINAKLFITANHPIVFDEDDSGIDRHVLYYRFKN